MSGERYPIIGLANARTEWFTTVARWATEAVVPIDFAKCLSAPEVRARLNSGQRFSAALVDAGIAALDRDLIDVAASVGCVTIVVADDRVQRDWAELGAAAVLPADFDRADLLLALGETSATVPTVGAAADATVSLADPPDDVRPAFVGQLVAVTGPGGVGRSTVAMALGQGLAHDPRHARLVALVDLCLHADLAVLHDAGDIVPGVQELVDAHRIGRPNIDQIRSLLFETDQHGYDLLLGLRRHRDWTTIRPRAFEDALVGLRRAYRVVVADVDPDLEGFDETGSPDLEDRNGFARATLSTADVVVAVGRPGLQGLHRLAQTIASLLDGGIDAPRIQPVINRAPKRPRDRSEITRALSGLLPASGTKARGPIFIPERRIESALRDGLPLPLPLVRPVAGAVAAALAEADSPPPRRTEPVTVVPGSLGHYATDDPGVTS